MDACGVMRRAHKIIRSSKILGAREAASTRFQPALEFTQTAALLNPWTASTKAIVDCKRSITG